MVTNRVLLRATPYLSVLSLATAAVAQDRPHTPSMRCSAVAALVAQRGALVLGTGPYSYERVVAHGGFCPVEDTTAPAWEATQTTLNALSVIAARTR